MSDASQAEREPEMDYPTSKLSAKDLTTLTESMGFTIIRAQKGLLNSTSLEGAIDWILNHENDNDIDDPISMVLKSSCKSADATHPYKCNECGKFLGNMTNLELHADKYGHSNFEETGQGMQLLSEEKNTQLQEINSSMVKSNHLGIRDGQDKLLDFEREKQMWDEGKKSAQTKEEMEKEARLIEAKVMRKKKRGECMKERAKIKAEIERDRLELEAYQGRPTSHRKTNRYNHDHGHQRDANADEKKSAETREEMEKEARLREVKLLMKKKREECTRERARIKAEIEKDRLEFKTLQLKPTSHLKTNGCNHGHGNQRDVNADEKKSAETREQIEKEARLIESKLLIKKKHKEFMKERARIKAEIEKDRLEFKTLQLKSNFEPMVDRYNPDGNHAKVNTNVATRRHPHEPVRKKKKGDVSKIDEYIQKISSYKAGGYGGKCLKILLTYITNIVDKPFEKKYRQINMDNKIFKSKVKPFVGAKMLLLAVGFSPDMDERNTALVLVDNANVNVLEQTKEKLERAYASYSISFNSWIPA